MEVYGTLPAKEFGNADVYTLSEQRKIALASLKTTVQRLDETIKKIKEDFIPWSTEERSQESLMWEKAVKHIESELQDIFHVISKVMNYFLKKEKAEKN